MKKIIILSILLTQLLNAEYVFKMNPSENFFTVNGIENSCKIHYEKGARSNGIYQINNSGKTYDVYCNMTDNGGGWTLVVAQFDFDPIKDWNEGIQTDYDPSLDSNVSFILNSEEIPSHTQTAFGKQLEATFIDYVDYQYQTGDLSKVQLRGYKTGFDYHIHRNQRNHHSALNPENNYGGSSGHNNSLTFDKLGGTAYTWGFAPRAGTRDAGFCMDGVRLDNSMQNYAWTVWVR